MHDVMQPATLAQIELTWEQVVHLHDGVQAWKAGCTLMQAGLLRGYSALHHT